MKDNHSSWQFEIVKAKRRLSIIPKTNYLIDEIFLKVLANVEAHVAPAKGLDFIVSSYKISEKWLRRKSAPPPPKSASPEGNPGFATI